MPRVQFTENLRRHVRLPNRLASGHTVREALEDVFRDSPELRGYVLDDAGNLRKHMAVFINGQAVRDRSGLSDPVGDESEVYVMQALSGG